MIIRDTQQRTMIQFRAMTDSEFLPYLDELYRGYADEQVKAGSWPADRGLELAKAEIHEMLPDGLTTQNNFLYSLIAPNEPSPIGVIWILIRERNNQKEAFIADIVIFDAFRRKGYGAQALKSLNETVKGMGVHRIRLQVFGHNKVARDLYEKSGYKMVNIYMEKQV
jgi:RimJ/RimL family protein N-acetyltransferase